MPIRLLTLDLDNTLWDTDPAIARAEQITHDWISNHCPQAASFYTLDAIREYRQQIAECYPELAFRVSKLREEVLRRVFLQSGLEREQAALMARQAFQVYYRERSNVSLFEGAREALETLASRYPLMAVSNGNADLDIIGIRHLFAGHFNAEQVGAPKPQPEIFLTAVRAAGVNATECLHIGDHQQQDIAAAHRLGMKTIWVNLGDAPWTEESCRPDQEITHLAQLPAAVQVLADRNT